MTQGRTRHASAGMAAVVEDHFVRTWTMIGTGAGGTLVETDDFQLTRAALDQIPYNHVQRCSPTRDADDVIDEIVETFGTSDAIVSLTSAAAGSDVEARLQARGSSPYSLLRCMSLDLGDPIDAPELPPDVRIAEVTPELLETWVDLVLDQWHVSDRDRGVLLESHRGFGFERVRRWVCFVGETAIARASAGIHEPEVAGIYGVGTKPEGRGRGLASFMMLEVLRATRAAGARTAVLQATPVAVDLYRRLGFVEHHEIPVYTLPNARPGPERMSHA